MTTRDQEVGRFIVQQTQEIAQLRADRDRLREIVDGVLADFPKMEWQLTCNVAGAEGAAAQRQTVDGIGRWLIERLGAALKGGKG